LVIRATDDPKVPAEIIRTLAGQQFERAWIGWAEDGRNFSVLTCSYELSTVERISLANLITAQREALAVNFHDADRALIASIRKYFAGHYPPGIDDPDVLAWYCDGAGARALETTVATSGDGVIAIP
jgi:hypothetical protein